MADPLLRQHRPGQIVQNVHLIFEVDREHGMGELAQDIPDHDQPQLLRREAQLAQRDVLGDGIILAIPGMTEELQRRRPIVALAIVLIVRLVAPVV